MKDLKGKVVVVTGGGSGMGRLMSLSFAREGASVVVIDLHEESAMETARLCSEETKGTKLVHSAYMCDVSDREAVHATCDAVIEEAGRVDILVNNAGIVSGKRLLDVSDEMIEKTFQVNVLALFWFIRKFLPGMLERDEGHIVNMASASGLAGVCGLVDYSSSKHAVVGMDESLRLELRRRGSSVRTTCVCPYYVNTGMFSGVTTRFPFLLPILDPPYVVGKVMEAVKADTAVLVTPRLLYTVPILRAVPTAVFDWVADFLGISSSMDDFKGRGWGFYGGKRARDEGKKEEGSGKRKKSQ